MERPSTRFRTLLRSESYAYAPVAYDPLGARLVEKFGFRAVCCGGYATGSSLCVPEPLLTRDEQLRVAGAIAQAVRIPLIVDAGAGFGEPLHTMRTIRECIRADIAAAHVEDQIYPKRAHYHKYVAHTVALDDFVSKIKMACRERDRSDADFVIIARTDTCRFLGLDEAVKRINAAAEVGADLGMLFPRTHEEAVRAPKECRIPLTYVLSRGNRDGRPLYSNRQLEEMGYKMGLDAQLLLLTGFHAWAAALGEMREKGAYAGLGHEDSVRHRQEIEDLIGLDEYYQIEEETVEHKKWGKR